MNELLNPPVLPVNSPTPAVSRLSMLRLELEEAASETRVSALWQDPLHTGSLPKRVTFQSDEPVPLPSDLVWRPVGEDYMWVAVRSASLVVLNPRQHVVMLRLHSKEVIAGFLVNSQDREILQEVIRHLALAGMIRGLASYVTDNPAKTESFARLHLTKACQLECKHCYAESSPRVDRSNEVSTERWAQFINEFAAHGGREVLFTGGEALMHPGCGQLMAVAKEAGLKVVLFSNGLLIPKYIREIAASANDVQISLDGPNALVNDAIRGKNTFGHIIKAVHLLAEAGVTVRIGMVVVPDQWDVWLTEFNKIRQMFDGYSNVSYRLNHGVMAYGRGGSMSDRKGVDRSVVADFIKEVNGIGDRTVIRRTSGCGYGGQIVVGPNGLVYPCHLLDAPICHIDDRPVTEITKRLTNVANAFDVDNTVGCKDCEIRFLCGGPCRVIAGRSKGSRYISTCNTVFKEKKIENLVKTYRRQVQPEGV